MDLSNMNGSKPASEPDPTYLVLVTWTVPGGQGGVVCLDQYTPRLFNRPSAFGPPHTEHCVKTVKEMLAQNAILGVQAFVSYIHRYEVVPSAMVDLRGGPLN